MGCDINFRFEDSSMQFDSFQTEIWCHDPNFFLCSTQSSTCHLRSLYPLSPRPTAKCIAGDYEMNGALAISSPVSQTPGETTAWITHMAASHPSQATRLSWQHTHRLSLFLTMFCLENVLHLEIIQPTVKTRKRWTFSNH